MSESFLHQNQSLGALTKDFICKTWYEGNTTNWWTNLQSNWPHRELCSDGKQARCVPHADSSVARGQERAATPPPIIARDELYDSSKSVEKLKGGDKLHFSPTLVAVWFVNVIKETGMKFLS